MKKSKLLRFISLGVLCALVFSLLPAYTPAANSTPTKLVALTFDDGPSKYTPRLLDGLKERGAKATFFMLGNCANTYPSTVKRAYEEGHQIASHTYDHPRLTTLSDAQVSSQVSRTKSALDSAIGAQNRYVLRPPYGDYNSRVLGQLGTAAIYWSVDSNDWRWTNNATKTVSEIKKNVFDGAIILLHDSHSWSVDAALTVIDDLQAQGYEFVTVSELFRRRGGSLSSGQIYYSKKSSGSDLPAISAPTVTLSVTGNKSYAVMSGDAGADIYYTVDGSVPNANSKKYTSPVPFEDSVYITAVSGYDMNGSRSPLTKITLSAPKKAAAPTIMADDNGVITLSAESRIYYTTDGTAPTEESSVYNEPFPAERGSVIAAFAEAGDGKTLPSDTLFWCYSGEGFIYADVSPSDWFYSYIEYAAANGLLNGRGDHIMAPDDPLTRGMLVTMLHRMAGLPEADTDSGFSDVADDSWYDEAVSWARQNRVASGYPDGTFRPDEPISREQLASVLYNYHRYALGLLSDSGYDLAGFEDGAQVASYALRPMKWAVKSGIIGGTGENSLSPAAPATRAQTAAMLMRFSELTKDEERYYISDEALTSLCASVLGNMSIRNLNGLAAASDKDTGLTFIYKAPSDTDVTLSPAELRADNDGKIRVWGKYADGTPARLTFGEYFEQFVWSADFIESNEIRLNDFADGHEIPGLYDKYPLGLFVDLRAKTASGDNVFLTLVFEKHGDEWLLSAIVSDGDILPAANVSEAAEDKTEADEQAPDGAQTEDIAEDTPDAAPAEDTAEAATDASPSEDAADEASSEPAPGAADSDAEDGESADAPGENAQDVQNG